MNKYITLEYLGFGIIVIGFIGSIVERLVAPDAFSFFTENKNIIWWSGLAMWALGYLYRQKQQKDKTDE